MTYLKMTYVILIIIILITYIYVIKFNHPDYKIVTYDDIKDKVKSGDMILFVSLDTMNQLFMFSYITHVGIIYKKNDDSVPVLVESFNPHRMKFYPKEYKSGIATCDLEKRLNSYRGFIMYKELNYHISEHANKDFTEFIEYAQKNMKYDVNVISNEINRMLFNIPFTCDVNCGTFTTLILIKLNLLNFSYFKDRQRHHLRFVTNLTKLKKNSYKDPVYIYAEYFKLTNIM
jgi:hypothetical protein